MKVRQRFFWQDQVHNKPLPNEAIWVDGFAGGGGASTGIRRVIGRDVHVAINHDMAAIGMHMQNHPGTKHYCENIFDVDPVKVTEGRTVAGAWFSPDCTHFSKARGEKPVSKKIRGLAGVVIRWARKVQPSVIFVENVEEFLTWGPVDEVTNRPIKAKAGLLFEQWVRSLRRCGYQVEWRTLVASDYGSPTTRKRLFIVARRDGRPIVWPEPTHGSPKQIARELKVKHHCRRQPWRTAAEIIDWELPCPSIFLTPEEAKSWGRANGCNPPIRPLAEKTMRRIAEGIRRFVIETDDPFIVYKGSDGAFELPMSESGGFIVRCNHGSEHFRGQSLRQPLGTVTQRHGYGFVTPFVSRMFGQSVGHDVTDPLGTVTGLNKSVLVSPFMQALQQGGSLRSCQAPMRTVTASRKDCHCLIAPTLMSYYGPRPGDGGHRGRSLQDPLPTQPTENRFGLVAAFLAKHFGGVTGIEATNPFPTITSIGTQNQLVAATLIKNNHGQKQWYDAREPLRTICAGGTHHAEVRAFLLKYYSTGGQWAACDQPMPTITAKDRLCLGIVLVDGEPFQIVDIGMRMLTPRELFRAQGFPDSYRIDFGINDKPATKTEQVARCGNSVCPQVVEALVRANLPAKGRTPKRAASLAAGL